jgi:hypothetical protein
MPLRPLKLAGKLAHSGEEQIPASVRRKEPGSANEKTMSKNKAKIEIFNPLPGGMRFTSPERVEKFRIAGLGVMRGNKFKFFEVCQEKRLRQQEDEYARQRQAGNLEDREFNIVISGGQKSPTSPRLKQVQWVRL